MHKYKMTEKDDIIRTYLYTISKHNITINLNSRTFPGKRDKKGTTCI